MTDLTNELRRLAQAATPGPWILLPVGDKSKCFAVADINLLSVLTVVYECGTNFGAVYLDGDAAFIAAANPAAVSELLDRLEEAESDCVEQALLLGMGSSREAALMAKLEAAEKEAAYIKEVEFPRRVAAVAVGWKTKCARLEQERDALLARAEEMEKQEPTMWANSSNIISAKINKERRSVGDQHTCSETKTAYHDAPLYALPGAKGE